VLKRPDWGGVRGFFEVVHEFFFGDVEQFDFGIGLEVGTIYKELEAAPGGFNRLKLFVVKNLVQLAAEVASIWEM